MTKKRFEVTIASVQTWYYTYEVDAIDEDEANKLGLEAHKQGKESTDNWVDGEEFYQVDGAEEVNT